MTVYYIIISLIIIFIFKNITAFFIMKDKVYIGFFFILLFFLSMILFNRILPEIIGRNNIILDIGDIFNIVFISGSVIFFSHYFLNFQIIRPLTIFYFYFEILVGTSLVGILLITGESLSLISLAHLITFIYSIVFLYILYNEIVKKKFKVNIIRIITLIIMQLTFIIMTICKTLLIPISIYLYSGIIFMIILMEFELMFRIKEKTKQQLLPFNLESLKEKDRKIVELLFNGLEYKEIASRTNLSLNTIKKYLNRIYREYNVKNKTELMNKFLFK